MGDLKSRRLHDARLVSLGSEQLRREATREKQAIGVLE